MRANGHYPARGSRIGLRSAGCSTEGWSSGIAGICEESILSAAEAMPADKYGFIPGAGEFKGVRTFGRQVKHLAATNQILAAAALGKAPRRAQETTGPGEFRTKGEILEYLSDSFAHLGEAIDAIGNANVAVRSSISPLRGAAATRTALVVEALIHAFDHYGQMVEYLRMNGIVPRLVFRRRVVCGI